MARQITVSERYTAPMRAVVQRVTRACVEVDGAVVGEIGLGLLVLLGVAKSDTPADAEFLAAKIAGLRVFADEAGKMNRSVVEAAGALLVVSQFTLYGDTRKGRRPSFDAAAPPGQARALYEHFAGSARRLGLPVATGTFQAMMAVSLTNDGPVTLIVESPRSAP
jgi:D-aminoacyl-tRNA deacylase